MRKAIEFILYLFYKYYERSRNTDRIAYEAAILAFLFLIFLNLITLLRIFNATDLLPGSTSDPRWLQYLEAGVLYFLPGYLIVSRLFRKNKIINLVFDESKIRRGNVALFLYVVFSFFTMIILAVSMGPTR